MKVLIDKLQELNIEYKENISAEKLTSWKVGGIIKLIIIPKNIQELQEIIKIQNNLQIKYKVLGKGSNVLISDKGINEYSIISLNKFHKLEFDNENNVVIVGAGYPQKMLATQVVKHGYSGLEFISGIPGTVGGAVFMNAGTDRGEINDVLLSAKFINNQGEIIELENRELEYSYRKSILQTKYKDYICYEANFKVIPIFDIEKYLDRIKSMSKIRRAKQPLQYPSCGSTFRNPKPNIAGQIIDEIGLKGFKVGGAMISEKHANFIINYNNATAQDILKIINEVQTKVSSLKKVDLICEVEMLGFDEKN